MDENVEDDVQEDNDLNLGDFLTDEEFEQLREQRYDDYYNATLSNDSLGICDRDFF